MRAVVQRVTCASVKVGEEIVGEIGRGLVILVGVARDDTKVEAAYLVDKISNLRIFDDEDGKMNLSVKDVDGALLIVSQFTLYGDVRRGLRPSWIDAAPPEVAEPLYDFFVRQSQAAVTEVATGKFQAMMQVELINDGPVTILVDSKKLF
jgi:D-tyrosyl-tRNA(Tyr) deacylase